MDKTHLPDADPMDSLAVLTLSGADARAFLQGQCTQNVATLAVGTHARAAILNPQGRVLAFGTVYSVEEGLRLLLPADTAETTRQHLARYILRSRVRAAVESPRHDDLEGLSPTQGKHDTQSWGLAAIRAGIPAVMAQTAGQWIPQMLNLDLLGAISFDKGCYTGQEIVARTQHLGRIKRRMLRFSVDGSPPEPLDGLFSADQKVAEVVIASRADAATSEFLAVTTLESVGEPMRLADGRVCRRAELPYSLEATA